MKAIDFRNETWESLQRHLNHRRLSAAQAWREHGPGTTREVARRAGWDILSFRPRSTELYQLGLLCLAEGAPASGPACHRSAEGIYRLATTQEWRAWVDQQRAAFASSQTQMNL
jgi:hypothetical protein